MHFFYFDIMQLNICFPSNCFEIQVFSVVSLLPKHFKQIWSYNQCSQHHETPFYCDFLIFSSFYFFAKAVYGNRRDPCKKIRPEAAACPSGRRCRTDPDARRTVSRAAGAGYAPFLLLHPPATGQIRFTKPGPLSMMSLPSMLFTPCPIPGENNAKPAFHMNS